LTTDTLSQKGTPARPFLIKTDGLSASVKHFMVGFAQISLRGTVEDATSAGSGTLVTIDGIHGVLTAAHVVAAFPKTGELGIILPADKPSEFRRHVVNMDHVEPPVVFRSEEWGRFGPDLAFFKLPDDVVGWLQAKSSFYNLSMRRDAVLANGQPSRWSLDCINGIIHELTDAEPGDTPRTRRIIFTTIFCGMRPIAVRYFEAYDLLYEQLATEHEPDFLLPNSFEGTSGGAIWRFYISEKDGQQDVVDKRLVGVPFFQGYTSEGKREITCHGARSIYGKLIDLVRARWPRQA
jgi:hypothetical protein